MSNIVKNRADAERLRLEASEAEASALLRIVRGSKDASAAETPLKRVMAALGAAEAKGSVCAKISDAVEQFSDLDPNSRTSIRSLPAVWLLLPINAGGRSRSFLKKRATECTCGATTTLSTTLRRGLPVVQCFR